MKKGAIVLCGGRSRRMGQDKANLPFGTESMLQRVLRTVQRVVDTASIVVVAADQQVLPPIDLRIRIARDARPFQGPLEGLANGLRGMGPEVDAVYVTSCDVPLLVPEFVANLFERLGDNEIAVPFDGEYHHPLAAVYRTSILNIIDAFLAEGELRPRALFGRVKTLNIPTEELRAIDPELDSLMNLNHPDDYLKALRKAGL